MYIVDITNRFTIAQCLINFNNLSHIEYHMKLFVSFRIQLLWIFFPFSLFFSAHYVFFVSLYFMYRFYIYVWCVFIPNPNDYKDLIKRNKIYLYKNIKWNKSGMWVLQVVNMFLSHVHLFLALFFFFSTLLLFLFFSSLYHCWVYTSTIYIQKGCVLRALWNMCNAEINSYIISHSRSLNNFFWLGCFTLPQLFESFQPLGFTISFRFLWFSYTFFLFDSFHKLDKRRHFLNWKLLDKNPLSSHGIGLNLCFCFKFSKVFSVSISFINCMHLIEKCKKKTWNERQREQWTLVYEIE